jgi:hypothetical protein
VSPEQTVDPSPAPLASSGNLQAPTSKRTAVDLSSHYLCSMRFDMHHDPIKSFFLIGSPSIGLATRRESKRRNWPVQNASRGRKKRFRSQKKREHASYSLFMGRGHLECCPPPCQKEFGRGTTPAPSRSYLLGFWFAGNQVVVKVVYSRWEYRLRYVSCHNEALLNPLSTFYLSTLRGWSDAAIAVVKAQGREERSVGR